MITELGTKRFKISEVERGQLSNPNKCLELTVSQYEAVSFDPKYLDELITMLTRFKELKNSDPTE